MLSGRFRVILHRGNEQGDMIVGKIFLPFGFMKRWRRKRLPGPKPGALRPLEALNAHGREFRQDLIEVTAGVYVAIGYGIANSIMIVGDEGVIVVDTLESMEAARRVAARFRSICDKPVKAIIYTHSHPDHILGAAAFVEHQDEPVTIYAQAGVAANADALFSELRPVITRRSLFMYGNLLDPDERTNVGIGPFVDVNEKTRLGMLRPTESISDRLELRVAGVKMLIEHAPGETEDQIFIWLPERKTLLPADNLYRAFPNLYTIRGTRYRDPRAWADSLDRMRALGAENLVPCHGRPLSGAATIAAVLRDYRDAIRYVRDQTIRMMNSGMTPDQIAAAIQLPPKLTASPYLQFFYGKPSWSARAIFHGEMGWFDGNPSQLQPSAPEIRARRLARLVGGEAVLAGEIDRALEAGEHQWVLELSDYLLACDPGHRRGKAARVAALRALAAEEINPNARHWYLTAAGELEGRFQVPGQLINPDDAMLKSIPLARYFDGLAVALNGEAAWDLDQCVVFDFADLKLAYSLRVRHGVTEWQEGIDSSAQIHVRLPSLDFRRMLAGLHNPVKAIFVDFEYVKGGRIALARFMRLFQPES